MFRNHFLQSLQQRFHTAQEESIFLVRGTDTHNQAVWHYVEVKKAKRDFFARQSGRASLDLLNYGKIILSGFGQNPPEDAVRFMRETYNFYE